MVFYRLIVERALRFGELSSVVQPMVVCFVQPALPAFAVSLVRFPVEMVLLDLVCFPYEESGESEEWRADSVEKQLRAKSFRSAGVILIVRYVFCLVIVWFLPACR